MCMDEIDSFDLWLSFNLLY